MASKKDLLKEANELADQYDFKKKVVIKILDDLDKDENFSSGKHAEMIPVIEQLKSEMNEIEKKQKNVIEQIKK